MRLKQLMANSLPRKKKQKQQKQTTNQQQILNNTTIRPGPPSPRDPIINDFFNSTSPSEKLPKNIGSSQQSSKINEADLEKLSPTAKNDPHFNVNFNVGIEDTKCGCFKHINPVFSPELHENKVFTFAGDNNFNSLPKSRTRIKTNPWLPSPRQTPVTSPLTSNSSSPSYSPTEEEKAFETLPINGKTELETPEEEKQFNFEETNNTLNIKTGIQKRARSDSGSGSMLSSDTDSMFMRSLSSETDNSITANEHSPFPEFLEDVTYTKSSCEGLDSTDMEEILESRSIEVPVSFTYEEAFESQIEAPIGKIIGSRDSLSDGYSSNEDVYGSSINELRYNMFNPKKKTLKYLKSLKNPDEDSGTDDTLCDEFTAVYNRRRSRRSRYRWKEDRYDASCDVTDTSCDFYDSDKENGKTAYMDEHNLSIDSAFESGAFSTHSQCSSVSSTRGSGCRSVGEIRMSLQEKVNELRKEKQLVDEKIRQAQEEERLRLQEKMRFQKQLTQHRKQILLRTLQDLKSKLENQSQRLQVTYTTVLSMQQSSTANRVDLRPHRSRSEGYVARKVSQV